MGAFIFFRFNSHNIIKNFSSVIFDRRQHIHPVIIRTHANIDLSPVKGFRILVVCFFFLCVSGFLHNFIQIRSPAHLVCIGCFSFALQMHRAFGMCKFVSSFPRVVNVFSVPFKPIRKHFFDGVFYNTFPIFLRNTCQNILIDLDKALSVCVHLNGIFYIIRIVRTGLSVIGLAGFVIRLQLHCSSFPRLHGPLFQRLLPGPVRCLCCIPLRKASPSGELRCSSGSSNIFLHLKKIHAEGELSEAATTEESSVVQTEGNRQVRRPAKLYNLDAIISVGYRVNSRRASEHLIERESTFTMEQFAASINEFLSFRRYDILPDKGKISARQAKQKAEAEYDLFNPTQKIISDFDKAIKDLKP